MRKENKLYGLVACGGTSARMGSDKSMLVYYAKPQRYHIYEMLENICDRVFISCNASQANDMVSRYETLVDLPSYKNIGPIAALLSSFKKYPDKDLLIIGCDYPFISEKDLKDFLMSIKKDSVAAAFYNDEQQLYEPLLAWYSAGIAGTLLELFEKRKYSLQHFLQINDAGKYYPSDKKLIQSIDTPDDFEWARTILRNKKYMPEES